MGETLAGNDLRFARCRDRAFFSVAACKKFGERVDTRINLAQLLGLWSQLNSTPKMKTIKILFPTDLPEMARCRVVTALRAAGYRSHLDGYNLFTLAPASVAQAAIVAADSSLATISATVMSALCAE